jgi:glycosyltransferase involved in cell wall biosynthesis
VYDRRRAVLAAPPYRLVSVSNLHEGKGIDITLEALAILDAQGKRDWTYTIVGDGAERRALAASADSLGLGDRVRFAGAQRHDAVFRTLMECDVFVLPSYREAFGIAYLEAMACGLPTIAVRGQGPGAFIEDGRTGFLVAPRSAEAVAACLAQIMSRPEAARAIGERARARAQEYTWDAHALRLLEVYSEAISAATP